MDGGEEEEELTFLGQGKHVRRRAPKEIQDDETSFRFGTRGPCINTACLFPMPFHAAILLYRIQPENTNAVPMHL